MRKRCGVCGQESEISFNTCSACLAPFIDTPISQVRTLRNKQESLKSNARAIELEAALCDTTLLSVLSQKEQSTVYLAMHQPSKEKRAVRVSHYTNEGERQRFLSTAALLGRLEHPALPKLHQHGTLPSGRVFMVCEYITGQSLRAYVKEKRQISPTKAAAIGGQILVALDVLHQAGGLHGNLRPENIYLREVQGQKVVTLLGFGVGQEVGVESPSYLSPEQARGEALDVRADLYSLGVVLFEMMTGRLPFLASSLPELLAMQREEQPPAPSSLVPGLPRRLDEVLLRCLEKHRDDRPVSAQVFKSQLLDALHSAPMQPRAASQVSRQEPRFFQRWMLVALAAGILMFGFLLGALFDQ